MIEVVARESGAIAEVVPARIGFTIAESAIACCDVGAAATNVLPRVDGQERLERGEARLAAALLLKPVSANAPLDRNRERRVACRW